MMSYRLLVLGNTVIDFNSIRHKDDFMFPVTIPFGVLDSVFCNTSTLKTLFVHFSPCFYSGSKIGAKLVIIYSS